MAFLREVRPRRVLSFHQPLDGVDTDTKDARFARRLARALRLPTTTLDCGGLCHGTMTIWYNARSPAPPSPSSTAPAPRATGWPSRRRASCSACSAHR